MSEKPLIRPMSFGEIFGETLKNYGRFFVPIFLVALVLQLLCSLVMLPMSIEIQKITDQMLKNPGAPPQVDPLLFPLRVVVTLVIVLALTVVCQAWLTVYYTTRLLGVKNSVGRVFARVMPLAGRLFGLSLLYSVLVMTGPVLGLGLSAVMGNNIGAALLLFVGGFIFAAWMSIRFSLGGAALVVESLTIRQALARSQDLSNGNRGKILLLGLIYFGAEIVLWLILDSFALVLGGTVILGFVSAVLGAFIYPFLLCGLVQVYLSARARDENLDQARLSEQFLSK